MAQTLRIERQPGDRIRARLPLRVAGAVMFALKQGRAAVRNDARFLFALVTPAFRDCLLPKPLRAEQKAAGS